MIVDDDTAMREAMAEAVRDLGHDPRGDVRSSGPRAARSRIGKCRFSRFRIRARPQPPPMTVLTVASSTAPEISGASLIYSPQALLLHSHCILGRRPFYPRRCVSRGLGRIERAILATFVVAKLP
jgi:hypothetical protein